MPPKPDVLTGLRDPQDVRLQNAKDREASGIQQVPIKSLPIDPSCTVYESSFFRYRVQITSPDEIKNPFTGQIQRTKPLVAQFENGRWVNAFKGKNPAETKKIRAQIDEFLQANDRFGLEGGDFWLRSDADARDQEIAREQTRRTIAALPREAVRSLLQSLVESGELDLELPAKADPNQLPDELNSEVEGQEQVAAGDTGSGAGVASGAEQQ